MRIMSNPIKVAMTIESEKKNSVKYVAKNISSPLQSAYINKKELPDSIPNDIIVTIDFVDWDYILGHLDNQNRKNR